MYVDVKKKNVGRVFTTRILFTTRKILLLLIK